MTIGEGDRMSVLRVVHLGLVCLLVAVFSGCAMFGGGKSPSKPMSSDVVVDQSQREASLRALVDRHLKEASKPDSEQKAQLQFRKPYHFKEYVEYPDGIDSYSLDISSTDAKGTPFVAKVRIAKKRYVTALEKKKSKARKNSVFNYALGTETLSYELRHGQWRETGSVFVAQESQTGSSVVASSSVEETVEDTQTDEQSSSGLFSKLKFWR